MSGAKIVYSRKEAFAADVVAKVNAPTEEEIADMSVGACLISALQLEKQASSYIQALNTKKITSLAFEYLEDKVGGMPVVRAMSEIAGSTVMQIASEYLSSVNEGKGLILGGITGVPPTQVVIIGAGTVAEYAARTALGLGANIKVFDNHLYKLRRIKQLLGQQIATSTIDNANLSQALAEADVVIGALRAEKGKNKICYITGLRALIQNKPASSYFKEAYKYNRGIKLFLLFIVSYIPPITLLIRKYYLERK